MECKKYEIIEDGGRKRIRSLRDFTVQDRHVCVGDLGGYVYDERTLGQRGNAWIFSGSLEYPGIHVIDEAIVDMGSNEAFANAARMNRVFIRGNSRIMGMMQFVSSATSEVTQTPAMYEQGYYEGYVGVPYEAAAREASDKVRSKVMTWSAGAGKVILPNAEYEIMCNKLDEDGVTLATTAWITGGPGVTIDLPDAPAFVLNVRKKAGGAITPADITAAGFKIQGSVLSKMDLNDVTLSVTYDRAATPGTALRILHANDLVSVLDTADIRVSYSPTSSSGLCVNCELYRTNAVIGLTPGGYGSLVGTFRDTELITIDPTFVGSYSYVSNRKVMSVSDCKEVVLSGKTQPDLAGFNRENGKLVFKGCNVPVGIFYYDHNPGGNVYEGIDFTKAMADLGKTAFERTTIVSSNVQGMYRVRGNDSHSLGMLVQDASSFAAASITGLSDSYDSVIYKDCTLTGRFNISGCNVFGGTLGGASKITNTTETAMKIDGSFRIEGNAQVTDTPLKGTGYIGGNAELKNGKVEGYIYMQDNAKYIPAVAANPPIIRRLIMSGNTKVLKQQDAASGLMNLVMSDNAVLDAAVGFVGELIMMGDSRVVRADETSAATIYGTLVLKDRARVEGTASVDIRGEITLAGNFAASGARAIYGKRVISDVSQIAVVGVPPTKKTW